MFGSMSHVSQEFNTAEEVLFPEHFVRKCVIVSGLLHASQSPSRCFPIWCKYEFSRHFPSRNLVMVTSLDVIWCMYLMRLDTCFSIS